MGIGTAIKVTHLIALSFKVYFFYVHCPSFSCLFGDVLEIEVCRLGSTAVVRSWNETVQLQLISFQECSLQDKKPNNIDLAAVRIRVVMQIGGKSTIFDCRISKIKIILFS